MAAAAASSQHSHPPQRSTGSLCRSDRSCSASESGGLHLAKSSLGRIELVYGTLLLLIWTLGGGIDLLNQLWLRTSLDTVLTGIGLILSLSLVSGLLELPFSLYSTFVLEERFGFNKTTAKRYLLDMLLQMMLSLLIGVPLLWAILWLMDGAGVYWWFAAWALLIGFMLLMTWIFPTLIAPLFNKFIPLRRVS